MAVASPAGPPPTMMTSRIGMNHRFYLCLAAGRPGRRRTPGLDAGVKIPRMRAALVSAAAACLSAAMLTAQQPAGPAPATQQPARPATADQQPAPPVFRAGIDVLSVDATALD